MRRQKGISLIVLVITIIVIIILASAVILSLANNNPIAQASEATFKSDIDAYNSELNMVLSNKYVQDFSFNPANLYAPTWNGISPTTGTIKELLPSITKEDAAKFAVVAGKLVYVGTTVAEKQWGTAVGIAPNIFDYNYTGSVQTFTAPIAGTYTLEVWGASGGGESNQTLGSHKGLGGYSKGDYTLTAGQTIYIYVGGQGSIAINVNGTGGGWNGGGHGSRFAGGTEGYGGGGATDIRTTNGVWDDSTSLNARIIVAGGGGGSDNIGGALGGGDDGSGGAGGGLSGENARGAGTFVANTGATQALGTFGKGQDSPTSGDAGGGGGGYRGGIFISVGNAGAGGGSGYIGGVTNGVTQTGGNEGNGRARITLL